jgi:hypothetical protein
MREMTAKRSMIKPAPRQIHPNHVNDFIINDFY